MKHVGLLVVVAAGIGVLTSIVVGVVGIAFEHGWTPYIAGATAAVFTGRVVQRIRPKGYRIIRGSNAHGHISVTIPEDSDPEVVARISEQIRRTLGEDE